MKKKEEIKPDGNDFHYEVKKALVDAGWIVRMSPYYNDAFSEKPREIDIIAEKVFPDMDGSMYTGAVIARLFVECKYIVEQTTFWFEKRNSDKAKKVVNRTRAFHETEENYEVLHLHHYLSESLIAKLYKTFGKNADGDPIFKAITQCLNATIYYRYHPTDLRSKYNHQSVTELNYPIIVCNSFEKFIKKDTTVGSNQLPITEPFLLEVDYAYKMADKPTEEMFYIDVTDINALKNFETATLLGEVNLAKQKMSDDKRQAAIERLFSARDTHDPFDIYG